MGFKGAIFDLDGVIVNTVPLHFKAWNNLGSMFLELKKLDRAVECFTTSLSITPDFAEAHNNLARALSQQGKDDDAGKMVANLMIVWADIPQVADRSLQEALRGVDASKLALALHKADGAIAEKIRANISERAAAMVDEEASLMSAPKKEDVENAREEIVQALRDMNEKGELAFVEE